MNKFWIPLLRRSSKIIIDKTKRFWNWLGAKNRHFRYDQAFFSKFYLQNWRFLGSLNNWVVHKKKPREAIWYPNRRIKCLYQMYFNHIKISSQETSCYWQWKVLFQLTLRLNFNILEAWFYSNESHSIGWKNHRRLSIDELSTQKPF